MKGLFNGITNGVAKVVGKIVIVSGVLGAVAFYGTSILSSSAGSESISEWIESAKEASSNVDGEVLVSEGVKSAQDGLTSAKDSAVSLWQNYWDYVGVLSDSTAISESARLGEFIENGTDDGDIFNTDVFFNVEGYETTPDELKDNVLQGLRDVGNSIKESAGQVWATAKEAGASNLEKQDSSELVDVTDSYETAIPGDTGLIVHVLDVGQASCTLFESGGEYMLFDGGDRGTSSYVYSYLSDMGIDDFKYVVASHYDSDHIAGLIGVIKNFEIETIIGPEYEGDTATYSSFISAVNESDAEFKYAYEGMKLALGNTNISVIAPCSDVYSDENGYSVGMRIVYGNKSVLICGDATGESESDMMESGVMLDSDIYIVNHHGSCTYGTNSKEWIERISPSSAVISCGLNNDYGHPHSDTLERLESVGAKIFRTDQNGFVNFYIGSDSYALVAQK